MVNWIWNKLLTKECVVTLIATIVILLFVAWIIIDGNRDLQVENEGLMQRVNYLEDRQLIIDRAILEGILNIHDALLQPVNYTEKAGG